MLFGITSMWLGGGLPVPNQEQRPTFYDALRTKPAASLAELRLAYRLRELELRGAGAAQGELAMAERAFNILADLELRACYDALLKNPETPVLFPYGGFGSLLVEGERSRDRTTLLRLPHSCILARP